MTKRLEEAFAEAAKLPAREQEALAEWVLEELSGEHRWMQTFAALKMRSGSLVMRRRPSTMLEKHYLDPECLWNPARRLVFGPPLLYYPSPILSASKRVAKVSSPPHFFEFNSSLCYHLAHGRFYHGEARSRSRCFPSIFTCSP